MNGHLSDNELQQYTVEPQELSQAHRTHIAACENCRLKAIQYRQITDGLKHLPEMLVELDLASLVLPATKKTFSWTGVLIAALVITGLLIVGIGIALLGRALYSSFLLPGLALILLVSGMLLYYREYRHQLKIIELIN